MNRDLMRSLVVVAGLSALIAGCGKSNKSLAPSETATVTMEAR